MVSSNSREMYLKTIYELEMDHEPVAVSQVAERLDVSPVSATEMVKRLTESQMVVHTPYKGVTLTEAGYVRAANVVRREGAHHGVDAPDGPGSLPQAARLAPGGVGDGGGDPAFAGPGHVEYRGRSRFVEMARAGENACFPAVPGPEDGNQPPAGDRPQPLRDPEEGRNAAIRFSGA